MRKHRYIVSISKTGIVALLLLFIGLFCTVKGIAIRYHLNLMEKQGNMSEWAKGNYIETDIVLEQFMGRLYTEVNGQRKYGATCVVDVFTGESRYIIRPEKTSESYITLVVGRRYAEELENLAYGRLDKFHLTGRIEKIKEKIDYDIIEEVAGVSGISAVNELVSSDYAIRIVDFDEERETLWKGLCLLLAGAIILFLSIGLERKEMS